MTQVAQQKQTNGHAVAPKQVDFQYNSLSRFTQITRKGGQSGTSVVIVSTFAYDNLARLEELLHLDSAEEPSRRKYFGNLSGIRGRFFRELQL